MTQNEAKQNQDCLSKHFNLAYWYGTNCKKCCGVYPKFKTTSGLESLCWYECEVCGKRTSESSMPWIAEEKWNDGKFEANQIRMF